MSEGSAYRAAGVDYGTLDAGKRNALTEALATSALLSARGGTAHDASRGEPAFAFEFGGQTFGFVLEGLGTKSIIARLLENQLGGSAGFAAVAYDTVAAIVNDLICIGALPLVVNAYFATGSSAWYEHAARQSALLAGWREACEDAGCDLGRRRISVAARPRRPLRRSSLRAVPSALVPGGGQAILGDALAAGDEVVFIDSSGLHANGSSLARLIASQLPDGYGTALPSGRPFGEALLDRSVIYVSLIDALHTEAVDVHYLSHITGHGLLKLMRPRRDFTYRITRLPEVPEVLRFLALRAGMDDHAAYSTLNMGAGFAVYCAPGSGERVAQIATGLGLGAEVAGVVEDGPRRVILEPLGVTFETGELDLGPGSGPKSGPDE